jgi:cyclopropane fatty-acyl-phospholipid synthase-like methyltransferase
MAREISPQFSRSEQAGIALAPVDAQNILSVGISTGGIAEMRMADLRPEAHIVATTIDQKGADFAQNLIRENGYDDRIDVRIEDVSQPIEYVDGTFDYVYARLVLHYLNKTDLATALSGLHRVVRTRGNLFAVVRSTNCPDAKQEGATYDPETRFTTCVGGNGDSYSRYYHTEQTLADAVIRAGFVVNSTETYDEQLYIDFMRTKIAPTLDNVVALVATKPSN